MTMAVYLTKKQQDRKSAKGDKYLRQLGQEIAVASFIRKISTFCDLPRRRSRSHSEMSVVQWPAGRSRYDWIEEHKGPGSETSEYKEARRVFYIEFDIYKEANPELFERAVRG